MIGMIISEHEAAKPRSREGRTHKIACFVLRGFVLKK